MQALAATSTQLRQLNVSWCWDISNEGIKAILEVRSILPGRMLPRQLAFSLFSGSVKKPQ
jgi:hypothetical protein